MDNKGGVRFAHSSKNSVARNFEICPPKVDTLTVNCQLSTVNCHRESVYLCGFMGCGKSHVGRMVAAASARRFVDLDREIVNGEGMTIPEIFEKYGEPHFRELEARYIRALSGGCVVATGGGALINDTTAEFARQSGLTVYINTSFEVCYDRIKNDTNRPLVQSNTKEQLRELYDRRAVIYRRNSVCMVNGNAADYVIAGEISKLAAFYEKSGRV